MKMQIELSNQELKLIKYALKLSIEKAHDTYKTLINLDCPVMNIKIETEVMEVLKEKIELAYFKLTQSS